MIFRFAQTLSRMTILRSSHSKLACYTFRRGFSSGSSFGGGNATRWWDGEKACGIFLFVTVSSGCCNVLLKSSSLQDSFDADRLLVVVTD